MTASSNACTITITDANKGVALSTRLALYESVPITVSLKSGLTFPAGSYTLALTYYGETIALAGCTVGASSLTCTLSLNTTEAAALFDAFPDDTKRIPVDLSVWDATARVYWGRGKVDVWRTDYVAGAVPTPATTGYYAGATDITNGQASVTVDLTSYALGSAPSQVFLSVRCPTGQDSIFVAGWQATATAITVQLSSAVPLATYDLVWLFFP